MDNINTFEASKFKGKLSKSENEEIDVIYERILQNTTQHSDGEGDHYQRNPARNRYGDSKLLSNAGIAYAKQHKNVPSKYDHKLKNQMMVHICADPIKMETARPISVGIICVRLHFIPSYAIRDHSEIL